MGARIEGIGTDTPDHRRASTALHGATHSVIPDRIETGTYACAAAITGGDVRAGAARELDHLGAVVRRSCARPASTVAEPTAACACKSRG